LVVFQLTSFKLCRNIKYSSIIFTHFLTLETPTKRYVFKTYFSNKEDYVLIRCFDTLKLKDIEDFDVFSELRYFEALDLVSLDISFVGQGSKH